MPNPARVDPIVRAARDEMEAIWRELGSPSPLECHPQMDAARRVYHAVLEAAGQRWTGTRPKLNVVGK